MKSWKRLDQTVVSKIGYRTIVSKFFRLPNGTVHEFETTNQEGWQGAAVVALTDDNKVIIARQGRLTDPGAMLLAYDELQRRRGKQ